MDSFNSLLLKVDAWLGSSPWFPFALLGVGVFYTLYLGFPQVRCFRHAWSVLRGCYDKPGERGDTSHFQSLSTALSGTVGTGNIGGVALAIYVGGPAALFWMWMTAFVGMATKMAEVTLSHKYRVTTAGGDIAGGPMYYMERGLKLRWLAVAFAVATVLSSFGTGNLPQINNIAVSVEASFGVAPIVTGAALTILLGLVIVGGIRRISRVASALVPGMAAVYVLGALAVIGAHYENIIPSFIAVFRDAFTGSAATGGFIGAGFAYAFNRGVNRGLFSNEAGQGSAPIAHAAARTDEPVSQGMVALLEPFIDTLVICTLTGLVILASGAWHTKHENVFQSSDMVIVEGAYREQDARDRGALIAFLAGDASAPNPFEGRIDVLNGRAANAVEFTVLHARSVAENVVYRRDGEPYSGTLVVAAGRPVDTNVTVSGRSLLHSSALTTAAFSTGLFGEHGRYIVSLSLVLFAFSTAIAWSYYGDRAIVYLLGPRWVLPYRAAYCLAFFCASFTDTTIVWNIAAVTVVLMTLPNLLGIVLLRGEMKAAFGAYWTKHAPSASLEQAAHAGTTRRPRDSRAG